VLQNVRPQEEGGGGDGGSESKEKADQKGI